jgi:hypothetical protein
MQISRLSMFAAAAGTVACVGFANAQPKVINISGASLLENFLNRPASAHDFIDVNNDGLAGRFNNGTVLTVQALAPQVAPPGWGSDPNYIWANQYRVVGSVNGFNELIQYGKVFVTENESDPNRRISATGSLGATLAFYNSIRYIDGNVTTPPGPLVGPYNEGNPGGAPVTSDTTTLGALWAARPTPAGGGIRIDISPLDVATTWATQGVAGTPSIVRTPLQAGYGTNPVVSVNKNGGTSGAGRSSLLSTLVRQTPPRSIGGSANLFDGIPANANSDTIFDTAFAFAPIAAITNYGTGYSQAKMSEMNHLFISGRMPNGENLMAITRDIGSGTRNAFNNTQGIDPSFGNGENIGAQNNTSANDNLGTNFLPSNKGGNSAMERAVRNHRLAIGYAGAERGVNGSAPGTWLSSDRVEILAIQPDTYAGGTTAEYSRPFIDDVLYINAGGNTSSIVEGYLIGGPAVFATYGDPRNQNEIGGDVGNTNPRMANPAAAAYVNNITRSIASYINDPNATSTLFMPGELAATVFILTSAQPFVHGSLVPTNMVNNPTFNSSLRTAVRNVSALNNSRFLSFNPNGVGGGIPVRATGTVYSDGVANGANYLNEAGVSPGGYGNALSNRNRIAGDFDGNGIRNVNDTADMMRAFRQRQVGEANFNWVPPAGTGPIAGAPGTDAVIEILGDFTGDGNFRSDDVRYFADGLAMTAAGGPGGGTLDRRAGFVAVDTEWNTITGNNNFFGTTKATPAPYAAGDARGDVANTLGNITPGFVPIGATGGPGASPSDANTINATDIDYVTRQFLRNPNVTDGALNWSNLSETVGGDLSADMTGDLIVNQDDVVELVTVILGTVFGDVNLDGVRNQQDCDIATPNLGTAGGWARGDVDGDGQITQADLDVICVSPCNYDYNQDENVDLTDAQLMAQVAAGVITADPSWLSGDLNGDENADLTDAQQLAAFVASGICPI